MMWYVGRMAGLFLHEQRARVKVAAATTCLFLLSPLFVSAQINALRQGMAALSLLIMVIHFSEGRRRVALLWAGAAISLHYTSVMYIATLSFMAVSIWILLGILFASFLLYVTGFTQSLVAAASSFTGLPLYQMLMDYGSRAEYTTGIRLDFAIASMLFLIIAVVIKRLSPQNVKQRLDLLARVYMCFIIPFFWLGWGAFSDRYAYTAWFMMSMVGGLGLYGQLKRLPPMAFYAMTLLSGVTFIIAISFRASA
jgi:hypothetical protein